MNNINEIEIYIHILYILENKEKANLEKKKKKFHNLKDFISDTNLKHEISHEIFFTNQTL